MAERNVVNYDVRNGLYPSFIIRYQVAGSALFVYLYLLINTMLIYFPALYILCITETHWKACRLCDKPLFVCNFNRFQFPNAAPAQRHCVLSMYFIISPIFLFIFYFFDFSLQPHSSRFICNKRVFLSFAPNQLDSRARIILLYFVISSLLVRVCVSTLSQCLIPFQFPFHF